MRKPLSNYMKSASLAVIALAFLLTACDFSGADADNLQNDPYNGIRRTYRDDGSLLAEVTYLDSVRHGLARNYYKNGKVQTEMMYANGFRHGEAKQFYESGEIFQVTPYVNDKRQGIQRKYYNGGMLMAEIPFENNNQVQGTKEYSRTGKLITRDVKIVFTLVDKTAFEDKFELISQLSDGSEYVKFFRHFSGSYSKTDLSYPINTVKGKAVEIFNLWPGHTHKEKIYIRGERTTSLRNKEIFTATYNLDIENKKQLQ